MHIVSATILSSQQFCMIKLRDNWGVQDHAMNFMAERDFEPVVAHSLSLAHLVEMKLWYFCLKAVCLFSSGKMLEHYLIQVAGVKFYNRNHISLKM